MDKDSYPSLGSPDRGVSTPLISYSAERGKEAGDLGMWGKSTWSHCFWIVVRQN